MALLAAVAVSWWWLDRDVEPLRLGFIGGLTGRVADLGVPGRDGALLAIEEVNAAGGVDGRRVELVARDDRQDAETASEAFEELVDEGVVAIIGPMTSAMAMLGAPIATEAQVLLVSPTVSTNALTGLDDWFFRIYPASAHAAPEMASYAFTRRGMTSVAVVYDLSNRAYTVSLRDHFVASYTALGGKVLTETSFTSSDGVEFSRLAEELTRSGAHLYLVLANAMDTAMLCQQLRKHGDQTPVLAGEWSGSEELLHYGGRAVDGLSVFHTFDREHRGERYARFRDQFERRFGYAPGFAAAHGYDATQVVLRALAKNPDPTALRDTIRRIGTFQALQGTFALDAYGDVDRDYFLVRVRDGRFHSESAP